MLADQCPCGQVRIAVTAHGIQGMYVATVVTEHHHTLAQQVASEWLVLYL